ncbi:unnamed protein product [Mytilus coruscus]|uniref:Uncharacterized protein n=1 Tax=Mytilus coruscus TaxID=42192 RepID=A0A6J8ARJ1_MYTCO|nr:unnamed protein product [Mytilus coruscus]
MAFSATNKERLLTEVQNNIDYCVRLLSSDTVDAEVTSNILASLNLYMEKSNDILVLGDITKSDKPTNKRLTGARIYTGQEMRDELKRKAEEQKEKEEGLKHRKAIIEAKRIEKQNVIQIKQSKRKAKSTKTSTERRKAHKQSDQSEESRHRVNPHIITVTGEVYAETNTAEKSDSDFQIKLCRPRLRRANKKLREIVISRDFKDRNKRQFDWLSSYIRFLMMPFHHDGFNLHQDSFDFHLDAFNFHRDAFNFHHDAFDFHRDAFNFHRDAFVKSIAS